MSAITKDGCQAECFGACSTTMHSSVFSHIEQGLRKSPHSPALICIDQSEKHLSDIIPIDNEAQQYKTPRETNCLSLSYSQLHVSAIKLAAGFKSRGVEPGTTILTLIPNGAEYGITFWSSILMRLTCTAMDPSILNVPDDDSLPDTIRQLRPAVVVVSDAADASLVNDVVKRLGIQHPVGIVLDDSASNGWYSFRHMITGFALSQDEETELLATAKKDDLDRIHAILFTSGTSAGRSKLCPQSVKAISHALNAQSWLINPENSSRVLQQGHNSRAIAPLHTLQTWQEGGAVIMPTKSFAVEDTVRAIIRYQVTFIVLTPAMVHGLVNGLAHHHDKVASVRRVQVGGDSVTKETLMKCAALFPKAKVAMNHGMTEGAGIFQWPFFDTPTSEVPVFGEICPIGTVTPGTKVRIWDAENDKIADRGVPGEMHISCESLIQRYLNGTSATSFYEDKQGQWFRSGDIAMIDEKDSVFILGRMKDAIRRNGMIIMPTALESCLEKFTGAQVSVVAVPHSLLGYEPFAVLSHYNGRSEKEIKSHVVETLGEDYSLGGISSLNAVGLHEFPINATHKIVKFEVQDAVLEYLRV